MFKTMHSESVKNIFERKIVIVGKDLESLLYNFLEELLILLDSKDFFTSKVKVKVDERNFSLEGKIFGDRASKYDISLGVKSVTYNEMFVKKINGRHVCQVVLDV